jgi:hypothetical protein
MAGPKVIVLSSRSLYAEGVLSRLREQAEQVDLQVVDSREADALAQIISCVPAAVIVDTSDAEASHHLSLTRLLEELPSLKIIRLDPQRQGFQVVTSEQHQAEEVHDLIDIIKSSKQSEED